MRTGNFGRDMTLDPKDFMATGLTDQVVTREPGTIKGQQFIIEDCTGCDIFLFDHSAAVQIDHCTNCRIFVGPCESSIFIRNCKDCKFVLAVQQFRTRECKSCDFQLLCTTEPIIELSSKLRFGCLTYSYFRYQCYESIQTALSLAALQFSLAVYRLWF